MTTRLFWIKGLKNGRLAISARPCGDEQLQAEVQNWKENNIDAVVSLLSAGEVRELGLSDEADVCGRQNIAFKNFQITDRGIPESADEFLGLIHQIEQWLNAGKSVLIHCRIGIGRSALVAALAMTALGVDIETAFKQISSARNCNVPDTAEQKAWALKFAQDLLSTAGRARHAQ